LLAFEKISLGEFPYFTSVLVQTLMILSYIIILNNKLLQLNKIKLLNFYFWSIY